MELDLYNQRFTTAQIAKRVGISITAANKRADKHTWEAAPVKTQGGGSVWEFRGLDQKTKEELSLALLKEHAGAIPPVSPEEQRRIDALWQEFDKKPAKVKERAFHRQGLLMEVFSLHKKGATLKASFEAVSQTHKVSVGTLRNWYFGVGGKQGVRGIDPKDWVPVLADNHKGRVARAECDEIAWEFLKKDYLRIEKPSFLSAYRRLNRAAEVHEWVIPSARTLYRRIFEEFTRAIIDYLRTGILHNDYPDQERRRDAYMAGQAVSGDALSFDKIYVYDDETGEVFNPRVWFFEDVYSARIQAWESDKTENSDMFRMALYNLTEHVLPYHLYIDNTRAAANKCLTGQVKGRHRFTNKADDPVGLLTHLDIETHFTNPDHEIASPGSKPVERAFGIGGLHSSMREWPSLIGRATSRNPIPYSEFLTLLPEVVAEHNARTGRTGGICNGRSFDQVYAEGLRQTSLRKASSELRRLLLCSQEVCTVSGQGTVTLKAGRGYGKHRYYGDDLAIHAGERVSVFFNPKSMSDPVTVYDLEARMLGTAEWQKSVAFNDTTAAREHAKHKSRRAKLIKKAAVEAVRMTDLEYKQLNVTLPVTDMPAPARTITKLSELEVQDKLERKISRERRNQLHENLQKNLEALGGEGMYPFAAQV